MNDEHNANKHVANIKTNTMQTSMSVKNEYGNNTIRQVNNINK